MLEFSIDNKARYKIKTSWHELSQDEFIQVSELLSEYDNGYLSIKVLKMRLASVLIASNPIGKLNSLLDKVQEISELIMLFYNEAIEVDRVIVKDIHNGVQSYFFHVIDGMIYSDLTLGQYYRIQELWLSGYKIMDEKRVTDIICKNLLNCTMGSIRAISSEVKKAISLNFMGIDNYLRTRSKYRCLFNNIVTDELPRIYLPISHVNYKINLIQFLDERMLETLN